MPVTNPKLIITAPQIIKDYSTFSTENVNTTRTSPNQLTLLTPRLPQGGGAIITTNLITDLGLLKILKTTKFMPHMTKRVCSKNFYELNVLNDYLTYWYMQGAFLEGDFKIVREALSLFYKTHCWIYRAIEVANTLVEFCHNFGEARGIVFADKPH